VILVNGEPRDVPAGETVAGLLGRLELDPGRRGVAVAVDGEVVPRAKWDRRTIADGARVEVLSAMQGG
jgi:sulfur carrier protein